MVKYQLIIHTDGACAGNPGVMGIGGVIHQNYPDEKTITFSEPAGTGTNNEAEYLAVIRALKVALELKPEGSVIIKSDSQLVVCQVNGEYRINHAHLARLHGKVRALAKQLPGKVKFQWISREQNKHADALASAAAGMPQAVIKDNRVVSWQTNYIPDDEEIKKLPQVNPDCHRVLNKLINLGDRAKFGDFIKLKTSGMDKYSRASVDKLAEIAAQRFGPDTIEWLQSATGGFDEEYGKTALRWVARGLPPDMALKKVSVDMEVRANGVT